MSSRDQVRMTSEEVAEFLGGPRVMSVATVGPTGRPHLVAMWYGFTPDGRPAFTTYSRSQKIKNIERLAAVTGLVEDGEHYDELRGVQLYCDAMLTTESAVLNAVAESVYERYRATADGPLTDDLRPLIHAAMRKRTAVVLDVAETVSWDHTKLAALR